MPSTHSSSPLLPTGNMDVMYGAVAAILCRENKSPRLGGEGRWWACEGVSTEGKMENRKILDHGTALSSLYVSSLLQETNSLLASTSVSQLCCYSQSKTLLVIELDSGPRFCVIWGRSLHLSEYEFLTCETE